MNVRKHSRASERRRHHFKWEVKENTNAVLSGECVRRVGKIRSARGELRSGGNLPVLQKNFIRMGFDSFLS